MAWVALCNGLMFLIIGIIFSALVFPYDFPESYNNDPQGPGFCERYTYPVPIGFLCAGVVSILYWFLVTFFHNGKTTKDHYNINNNTEYRLPVGFILFNLLSAAFIIVPTSLNPRTLDFCGDLAVGWWSFLVLMPIAAASVISSFFYIINHDKLACIPTRSARYWMGLYPITWITMWWWCLLCCSSSSRSQQQQQQQQQDNIEMNNNHDQSSLDHIAQDNISSGYTNSARETRSSSHDEGDNRV